MPHYLAMTPERAQRFAEGRAAVRMALIADPSQARETIRAVTGFGIRTDVLDSIRHELELAHVVHVFRPRRQRLGYGTRRAHDLDHCWCTQPEPKPERRELSSPDNLKPWPARATTQAGASELYSYMRDSPLDCGHAFTTGGTQPFLDDIVYCRRCMQFRVVTEGRTMPGTSDEGDDMLTTNRSARPPARPRTAATHKINLVSELIADQPGITDQEIADAMGISSKSAGNYRREAGHHKTVRHGASTSGPGLIDR